MTNKEQLSEQEYIERFKELTGYTPLEYVNEIFLELTGYSPLGFQNLMNAMSIKKGNLGSVLIKIKHLEYLKINKGII